MNEYFGVGSINKLTGILKELKPSKIMLITGKSSYVKSGAKEKIGELYNVIHYEHSAPLLDIKEVKTLINKYEDFQPDLIIGVGGGSVIDLSKIISMLKTNDISIDDYLVGKDFEQRGVKLIAIPTTAGTGSEGTHFAVMYKNKVKHSITSRFMKPDYAIIDPSLTYSMPKNLTATTGLDALCQGIESYWSINSTKKSRSYAKKAIDLAIKNLPKSVNEPTNESRKAMSESALMSGKGINISKTTASHAFSYPLTSFFGVPHGHAVALTIPYVLEFNYKVNESDCNDQRGVDFVKEKVEEIISLTGGKKGLIKFVKSLGLEVKLSNLGIKKSDFKLIIKNGFNPQRVKNNPRVINKEDFHKILEEIL